MGLGRRSHPSASRAKHTVPYNEVPDADLSLTSGKPRQSVIAAAYFVRVRTISIYDNPISYICNSMVPRGARLRYHSVNKSSNMLGFAVNMLGLLIANM